MSCRLKEATFFEFSEFQTVTTLECPPLAIKSPAPLLNLDCMSMNLKGFIATIDYFSSD